jgi:hypothetical protein
VIIRATTNVLDQTHSHASTCLSTLCERAARGAPTLAEWDAAREAIEALPLAAGEAATARNRLANARRYLDAGQREAAGYELRLLTRSLTGRPVHDSREEPTDEPDTRPVRIERVPVAAVYAGYTVWPILFGVMGFFVALCKGHSVLPALGLVAGGIAFFYVVWNVMLPVPWWPQWVEFGERFRYRNCYGTYTHEWTEVEAIRFGLARMEDLYPDDADDVGRLVTNLRVTLRNGRVLNMLIRDYDLVRGFTEEAVRGLLVCLESERPSARRRAAIALGLFRPIVKLPELKDWERSSEKEADGVADVLLADVLPRLLIAADDPDERVRDAVGQTLASIRIALGVTRHPWTARRPNRAALTTEL